MAIAPHANGQRYSQKTKRECQMKKQAPKQQTRIRSGGGEVRSSGLLIRIKEWATGAIYVVLFHRYPQSVVRNSHDTILVLLFSPHHLLPSSPLLFPYASNESCATFPDTSV